MIVKFNGGLGAVLCSNCWKVMYSGASLPKEFKEAILNGTATQMPEIFCCDECEKEFNETSEKLDNSKKLCNFAKTKIYGNKENNIDR